MHFDTFYTNLNYCEMTFYSRSILWLETAVYIFKSSENNNCSHSNESHKSLIKSKNNNGSKFDPCVTPLLVWRTVTVAEIVDDYSNRILLVPYGSSKTPRQKASKVNFVINFIKRLRRNRYTPHISQRFPHVFILFQLTVWFIFYKE